MMYKVLFKDQYTSGYAKKIAASNGPIGWNDLTGSNNATVSNGPTGLNE